MENVYFQRESQGKNFPYTTLHPAWCWNFREYTLL